MQTLDKLLKSKREALNLTQEELARKVGVAPVYISQLERRVSRTPSDAVCRKLAEALQLDVREIFRLVYHDRLPPELQSLMVREPRRKYRVPSTVHQVPVIDRDHCSHWLNSAHRPLPSDHTGLYEPTSSEDPAAFYVVAQGEQMQGFGIDPGDYLLIEPNAKVQNEDIVLFRHPQDGVVVRRYIQRERMVELWPGQDRFAPLLLRQPQRHLSCFLVSEIRKKTRRSGPDPGD